MEASHRKGPKLILLVLGVLVLVWLIFDRGKRTEPAPESPTSEVADDFSDGRDEITVDLRDGTTDDELKAFSARHHDLGLHWASKDPSIVRAAIALARVPVASQPALLKELRDDPLVEHAEHNGLMSIPDETVFDERATGAGDVIDEEDATKPRNGFPNDSLFDKQWHMRMIHAVEAWKYTTGKGVIVGVIDTGVAYETKRSIRLPDLDKTAFAPGYDFVNDDAVPADDHGHGSHCAGTIAQSTDNGRGCAGVAPGATIMPLKVLTREGWGTTADIADAIRWAADHKCNVMNLSLGGGGHSQVMADAVWYAYKKGCVVCCAAGNGSRERVEYPAAYKGALAVSSVGPSGKRAFYSSYGKEVWVAGPGGDKSRSPQDGVLQNTVDFGKKKSFYGFWQGTSMATPHVAGVSALLVSLGVTNPAKVREILAETAMKPDGQGGWDKELGYGIIDAQAACSRAATAPNVLALLVAAPLLLLAFRGTSGKELSRALAVLGAIVGATGFFLATLAGLGELPLASIWAHALADWDPGNPLLASALVPCVLGLALVRSRPGRSLAVGLALGCAAHLLSAAWFDYARLSWVPSLLERPWLAGNACLLVVGSAMLVRLGRGKGAA